MLIVLTWISFWVNRRALNTRLALCVLSMLLMVLGCFNIGSQIPKTAYTKAIDVYTGVTMTFIFLAVAGNLNFQFLVNFYSYTTCIAEFAYISSKQSDTEKEDDFDSTPAKVDKFFRFGYPIAFAVFNVLYWTIY